MNKRKQRRLPVRKPTLLFVALGIIVAVLLAIIITGIIISSGQFTPKESSGEIKQVEANLKSLNLPVPDDIRVENKGCSMPLGQSYCFWAVAYNYSDPSMFWPALKDELTTNWTIGNDEDGVIWAENRQVCLMVRYFDTDTKTALTYEGYVYAILKGSNGCNQ